MNSKKEKLNIRENLNIVYGAILRVDKTGKEVIDEAETAIKELIRVEEGELESAFKEIEKKHSIHDYSEWVSFKKSFLNSLTTYLNERWK